MDLSYQEKSILGSLLAMVAIYGYYFANTLRHVGEPQFEGGTLGRLIITVIALIVVEIVYHIVLAIEQKPERKDERDVLIECKAYRNAYLLLASGAALLGTFEIIVGRVTLTPYLTVNLLLLAMVAGELTKLLTQLFYYRRGLR
ncbi:MAG: hypothetical protein WA655_17170 [Candidatus Korobacteraceae bacterium]